MVGKQVGHMKENMMKIAITANPALIRWIDERIKKKVYRNRSHAFDIAGDLLMASQKKV